MRSMRKVGWPTPTGTLCPSLPHTPTPVSSFMSLPIALTRVTMIGDDFSFDNGVGVCGKSGQSVPVGVGQPSLKITGLTVGGTSV